MSSAAEEPGPPPAPPPDLHGRSLPIHTLDAGAVLFRVHLSTFGALFFGPPPGAPPRGRWEAPGSEFRVCYLAEEPRTAFAETFLRAPGLTSVAEREAERRSLARVRLVRPLRLVAMHGRGLARLGATAAVCTGPWTVSRRWSLALHGHPEVPDGIRYRARHDDDGFAIALFDRSADAVEEASSASLVDPAQINELGAWLSHYGLDLV